MNEAGMRAAHAVNSRDELLALCARRAAPVGGLVCEFGVHTGGSLRKIVDLFGPPVIGFDSFTGLPEPWYKNASAITPVGYFACDPPRVHGAELIIGPVESTAANALDACAQPIRFAHLDLDLYSATRVALGALQPWLRPGSILLFDELMQFEESNYDLWFEGEWRALLESGIRWVPLARTRHEQCAVMVTDGARRPPRDTVAK